MSMRMLFGFRILLLVIIWVNVSMNSVFILVCSSVICCFSCSIVLFCSSILLASVVSCFVVSFCVFSWFVLSCVIGDCVVLLSMSAYDCC